MFSNVKILLKTFLLYYFRRLQGQKQNFQQVKISKRIFKITLTY